MPTITCAFRFGDATVHYTRPSCQDQVLFHIRVGGEVKCLIVVPVGKLDLELSMVQLGAHSLEQEEQREASQGKSPSSLSIQSYPSRNNPRTSEPGPAWVKKGEVGDRWDAGSL